MAEVVLPVLLKIGYSLGQEAVKKISREVSSVKELRKKIENIGVELNVMNDFLLYLGTNCLNEEEPTEFKGWLEQVRTLAYRAEDVVDKYSYYAHKWAGEGRLKKFFKSYRYASALRALHEITVELDQDVKNIGDIKERWLRDLLSQLTKRIFENRGLNGAQEQRPRQCSRYFVEDQDLVGMDEKRNQLTQWLMPDEKTSTVMILSGIGGLGKSNLVKNIFEKEKRERKFNAHAWIVLSHKYKEGDFLRELIDKINVSVGLSSWSPSHMDSMSVNELKKELEKAVKGKRCMVVLDDVWDDDAYNEIHDIFQGLQSASRIIITTRKRDGFAEKALERCRIEFQAPGYGDAHNLFCSRSSLNIEACSQGLRAVAQTVVKECGNHPLAVTSIAKKLSTLRKNETEWTGTSNQLRSELANDPRVRSILHHTYDKLDQELKNCFLYSSLFPEGYPMRLDSIARMFVAEGLVEKKQKNTPEMVARSHIRTMIDHNMLQHAEVDASGEVVACKVDPIMRILALALSAPVQFGVANDDYRNQELGANVRRLSACQVLDRHASNTTKCPHLRTLIAVGGYTSVQDKLFWISAASVYLVVLEFEDSPLEVLPNAIGYLFNLRYLGLRRTNVKSLPKSISRLLNMQTLDLKSTSIEKLPKGIKKLNRLQHLFADKVIDETGQGSLFFKGVAVPKGFSSLRELQTLETVRASIELGKQLDALEQLRSLSIDNVKASECEGLFTSILKKRHLTSLIFSACDLKETIPLNNMEPTSMERELQKLVIRGCLAEGMLRNFIFCDQKNRLQHLHLTSCQFGEDPLQLLAIHLPELTYLSLDDVECTTDLDHLVLPEGNFRFLKSIFLKGMKYVKVLTIQDLAIPQVETLSLDVMPNLGKVPHGLESLRSLKELRLNGLAPEFRAEWDSNGWHQKLHNNPKICMKG